MNPFRLLGPGRTASSSRECPGQLAGIRGVILQSDARSMLGHLFIRPAEALDQWWAGLIKEVPRPLSWPRDGAAEPPLAMHAGLHVVMKDGSEFVLEQLAGGFHDLLVDGLHWTPLEEFREREHPAQGGWDATVPLESLRQLGREVEGEALARAVSLQGRPFWREDCTAFIGRVFGERRVFADSPLLGSLGLSLRSGEPALPSICPDAQFPPETERRLRAPALRALPTPHAPHATTSLRQVHSRGLVLGLVAAAFGLIAWAARTRRKPAFAARRTHWF